MAAWLLDHHLLRSRQGLDWLSELSTAAGRRILCAADFMKTPRLLLEADRTEWYRREPVSDTWQADDCRRREKSPHKIIQQTDTSALKR